MSRASSTPSIGIVLGGLVLHCSNFRYRARAWRRRLQLAWRYTMRRLSPEDAQHFMQECYDRAGWHPLLVPAVEDALDHARGIFADHPELPRLIADGCACVGGRRESYGDELYDARRWAIDIAESAAAEEGIILARLDDIEGEPVSADVRASPHREILTQS